jgi:hypothetical protein
MNYTPGRMALTLAVVTLPLIASCSDDPAPKPKAVSTSSGSSPSASASASASAPSVDAEKAEILKVRAAYGKIQEKLLVMQAIPVMEINAVTTDPLRTKTFTRIRDNRFTKRITTGPSTSSLVKLTVNDTKATMIECHDSTRQKTTEGPERKLLRSPSRPLLIIFLFAKSGSTWKVSDIQVPGTNCTIEEPK